MMVVGYNGILFQDVGLVKQVLRNFHKISVTCKSLGNYQRAPALNVYRRKTPGTQKGGEINDSHQTFWSLYLFWILD